MRGDRDRLLDVLEAIARIDRHTRVGRPSMDDELVQTWVLHNLEILGEAARGVSDELRQRHPDLPWREMGLPNVLAYGHFGVDVERVWTTVERDLPTLKRRITSIIEDNRGSGRPLTTHDAGFGSIDLTRSFARVGQHQPRGTTTDHLNPPRQHGG